MSTELQTHTSEIRAQAEDTSHLYTILVALFAPLLLISNIAATKGVLLFESLQIHAGPIQIDGLITDGAFFMFPLAYVMGDVITEVYGFKAMRRAMWLSFIIAVVATAMFAITLALPPAPFWHNQEAMASVLGTVPQILLASLAAYVVGTTLNAFTMTKLKARHGEKNLVTRMISSTVVGEAADTMVFCAIAATAIGISTATDFINYVLVGFTWKTLVEVGLLPLSTSAIAWAKRAEPSYHKAEST